MIAEGKGMLPPKRVRISITARDVTLLAQEASKRDSFRAYTKRNDVWGKGLMKGGILGNIDLSIPASARPILIGLGGEWAACELLRRRCKTNAGLDLSLKQLGDGGSDLVIRGVHIDVKCRSQTWHPNRVRVRHASGFCPKLADAFVFCEWVSRDHIDVLGWVNRNDLQDWSAELTLFGHTNRSANDESLKPIGGLVSLLDSQIQG